MGEITFEIDGKKVKAAEGETILQVARREGIYIPTMCYLTKLKPIASCRLCVVEVEGLEAPILSCQERPAEGIKVRTDSEELYRQRQNIIKLYDVNHPLQCGVCDQSGECDLQNKTLEFDVREQSFSAMEQYRKLEEWGPITYDPYLCILCERCVRVSNEILGDEALKISTGGYNSRIINVKAEEKSLDWGALAEVCPVGALVDKDFKYKANAWELKKIPAVGPHTSDGEAIYYEVKNDLIYRVTNDYEYATITGVNKYGYTFANRASNTPEDLERAADQIRKADTIRFGSVITNEEALILQRLKEKYGLKLINDEARHFQKFLRAFSKTAGRTYYKGTLDRVAQSDFILTFGTRIADDAQGIKFRINQAAKSRRAEVVYMHPIEDHRIQNIVTRYHKYEVGSEESVLALLAKAFLAGADMPKRVTAFFDDLDEGYISAESNIGEEEIEELLKRSSRKRNKTLIAGKDLYAHPAAENIARMLGLLERYAGFEVLIIPPSTNTLGVSLICELDDEAGEYVVGYNAYGDFILGAISTCVDVNMPALNQQEGTITTIDKRVVPTYVARPFEGGCLNDIATILGVGKKYTIDFTPELPQKAGFENRLFDDLPIGYSMTGEDKRGYFLQNATAPSEQKLAPLMELMSYDGPVVYLCNPSDQKNAFTAICHLLPHDGRLRGSQQFALAAKIEDGDRVEVVIDGERVEKEFVLDEKMKGTIALMPTFELGFFSDRFESRYRFSKAKIKQVGT